MAAKNAGVTVSVRSSLRARSARKTLVPLSAIGLLLAAAAPAHPAEYTASANCEGTEEIESGSAFAGAECGYGISYPTFGFVSATSEADPTGLYASAHGAGYLDGTADAIISDNYFVASGGSPGSTGTLDFTFYVHGISADPSAIGQAEITADNPAVPVTTPGGDILFEQSIDGVDTVSATSSLGVGVTLGVPNGIEVDLHLYSLAGYIDFSDTVELVGIEAFDSNGNPISGDIMGDGGFDYSVLAANNAAALGLTAANAPEAPTWALLLIGFAGLGGATLYRGRSRPA
jgi:hypothetical protein